MIDLRSLQLALGGEIVNGRQLLCPGPGHSPRDRSLSVWPTANGFNVHSHSGDPWDVCKDYVRERLGMPAWQPGDGRDRRVDCSRLKSFDHAAIEAESGPRERTEEDWERIGRARQLWDAATDPRGTLVETYLRSRALVLADDVAGSVLRYHPQCPWRNENSGSTVYVPTLVAAFTSIDDNTVTAIHRIRLDQPQRWPKAERRMLGIVHRAAVKLDHPTNGTLSVGEGIETCLAARMLGHAPAWATGSVSMISKFPVIDGVNTLRILGETGEASAQAIRHCGNRWHRAGRRVQVVMPDVGDDLNTELMWKTATV